jgi:Ca-activated chloride channel family protein
MIKIFANKNAGQFTVMPKEILFTIDCSLSISPERLGEFKRGITYCLTNLNKDDLFNIVAFQDKALFFAEKSLKATPETIKQAERFVSELTSNRNTDVYGALEKIIKTPPARNPSNIILISDGRPTHGVVNSRELINSVTRLNDKVRPIFAYSGGAKVNRYLLDFIAYQNRAWSQFVKDRGKIHKGLGDFYAKIKDPIFLNLRYQLNGLNNDEVFPKSLPDFYRNAEFTLYGKYENENDFSMQLLGDVEGKTNELIFTRSLKEAPKGGPDIMKGYAFNKIYYLISQVATSDQSKEILKQIQELGQKYKVTTPYSPELAEID